VIVHAAEIVLRQGVTLFGGLAIPLQRLGIVLCQAEALVVHDSEIVLRIELTLLGRLAKPPRSLGNILRDALSRDVHDPEIILGIGIPLFGQRPQQPQRGRVVAFLASLGRILQRACGDRCGKARHQKNCSESVLERRRARGNHRHRYSRRGQSGKSENGG
jgi:hypothetical protein